MIRTKLFSVVAIVLALLAMAGGLNAQNSSGVPGAVPIQPTTPYFTPIPLSATAAINTVTTLTVPAPATGLYNYICFAQLEGSTDGSAAAVNNAVTSTTNFNSFATKFSIPATNNLDYVATLFNVSPGQGCVKSQSPATSTTFVSPQSAHVAYSWYVSYYQAP